MEDFLKPYMDWGLLYPADTPESVIEKIRGILDVSLTRQPG